MTTIEPRPTSRTVIVGGLAFHYLDYGGDGPPLLLLHATGFHAWLWHPYARRFAKRYRVLALDQRGHGKSAKPASGYRWENFGRDLAGFLDEIGVEEVRAVGHSKGATAIAAAAAAGCRRFRCAVLIEPVLLAGPPPAEPAWQSPLAVGALRRRMVWPDRETMFATLAGRPTFATWSEEFLRAYVDMGVTDLPDGTVELLCPGQIEAQVYANAPLTDGFTLLERLEVPTLLIRGADSVAIGDEEARQALQRLPDAELVSVPAAGHFVPMERPDVVAKTIGEFIDRR